ncbi:MAG: hypothetical protein AAGD96_21620, partial [Chloroflexota bacterium]
MDAQIPILENKKQPSAHDLWVRLSEVLSGILDAHGVCEAFAEEISKFTGCYVMSALTEPNGKYFDVW